MTDKHADIRESLTKITLGKWEGTVIDHEGCNVWPWYREEDMDFAYNAPEYVRRLLDEVDRLSNPLIVSSTTRRLGEENERLRKALEEIASFIKS